MSIFWLYPELKMSFEHSNVCKNLFLFSCFCWISRLSLLDMDQKFHFGGTHGYGDSYLENIFRHSKEYRVHALLQDAAGVVRVHSGKSSGYCCIIGRGANSYLLDHFTGVHFCLYVKLFLHSIFKSVDFWSSISRKALDIELADIIVIKELGVLIVVKVQGYSFCPPKMYKPTKQAFWCTRHLARLVWNSKCLEYSEHPDIFPRDVKGECSAKWTEKCNIFGSLVGKDLENLGDHGCPKSRDLVDEVIWICSSYLLRYKPHFIVRSARQNCLVIKQCSTWKSKFFVLCDVLSVSS